MGGHEGSSQGGPPIAWILKGLKAKHLKVSLHLPQGPPVKTELGWKQSKTRFPPQSSKNFSFFREKKEKRQNPSEASICLGGTSPLRWTFPCPGTLRPRAVLREEQGKQSPLLATTALKLEGEEMKSCLQTKARLLRNGETGKKETISSISPASLWGEMGFLKGDVQLVSTLRLLQPALALFIFFSLMQPKIQMHWGGGGCCIGGCWSWLCERDTK